MKSAKNTFVARALMHLRLAGKHGVLAASDPAVVIEVAANLVAGVAAIERRPPKVEHVLNFIDRYNLAIGYVEAEMIVMREFPASDGWLTTESIGARLNLTVADQERHRLWTLGVRGETTHQQRERTAARRQRKVEEKKALKQAERGPFWINVSEVSRQLGISRPTVYKLKDEWEQAVNGGDFAGDFYSFAAASRENRNKTVIINGRQWTIGKLMDRLGKSDRTIRRWLGEPGRVEQELFKLAGKRPPEGRVKPAPSAKQKLHPHKDADVEKRATCFHVFSSDSAGAARTAAPAQERRRVS